MSEADKPADTGRDSDNDVDDLRHYLSEQCCEALKELQKVRPEAELIAVKGDWAWVSIGTVFPKHVNDVFDHEKAHAIIRIPTDFPTGRRPYGIVTIPYVTKHNGQEVHQEMRDDRKAAPVEDAMDVDETGIWSYKWDGISWEEPADLQKAPEIVRSRFEKED